VFFLCGESPTSSQLILFSLDSILGAIITTQLYPKPSNPTKVNFLIEMDLQKIAKSG
jgi:hypothetical protein